MIADTLSVTGPSRADFFSTPMGTIADIRTQSFSAEFSSWGLRGEW